MLSFLGPTLQALALLSLSFLEFFCHTVDLTKFFTMHIHSIVPSRFPPYRTLNLKQIDIVEMKRCLLSAREVVVFQGQRTDETVQFLLYKV